MTASQSPHMKTLRRWAWSPFVVLPPILLIVVFWPRETPQPPIFDAQLHSPLDNGLEIYLVQKHELERDRPA